MGLAAAGACQGNGSQDTSGPGDTGDCGVENCVCDDDSDCAPGLVCASRQCTPEGDGSSSSTSLIDESTTGTTSEPGSSSESSGDSSGPPETSGVECRVEQGVVNGDCTDPKQPYCNEAGVCVGCVELGCEALSDVSPVCNEASGLCEQCSADDRGACEGATPVCSATNTCTACVDHEQCSSGACNFATGACFEQVLHVDRAADCASGDGSSEAPFCEIQDAVDTALVGEPVVVKVKPSPGVYAKQVQVGAGRSVAIVRDGNGAVTLNVADKVPVSVDDGAMAYLYNLRITGGTMSKGLQCLSASVWLDRVQIDKREGHAIDSVGCALTIRRSKIYDNNAGGVRAQDGSVRVENSYIVQNGNTFADFAGITLQNTADLVVLYSTIADNDAKPGMGESLDCMNAGTVSVRNSIVFGTSAASSVNCPGAMATTSVVDSPSLTGNGVEHEPELDPSWFIAPASGNFAIKSNTPFEDVAVWRAEDPRVDYDGDPRLSDDGALDYTGADRPN